ncbi:DUF1453 domain-containing protein [Streptomyces sp. NPDC005840]|uniref:DUF1453 domain-containing protein n=1 Tax=Streptomyces sp. NPDC005840 TaxID=3157072 RepID=UPI00340BE662
MSGLVNALVIAAVVVLVIVRQFRAQQIGTGRRWWLLPAVLGFVALREPGLVDSHHPTTSVTLLVVELLVGLAMGAGWAWTTRIWTESDGTVWSKSTRTSAVVWVAGIAVRVGLYALGAALGVHQHGSALLAALAVTLLVRSGILYWRAQSLTPATATGPAYGDRMARSARKERV